MVPLRKMPVRIIVHQPAYDWGHKNLFGTIIKDRNNNLLVVKLTHAIQGKTITSDLLRLTPQTESDSFRTLAQLSSTLIIGELIDKDSEETDFVLTGTVTSD